MLSSTPEISQTQPTLTRELRAPAPVYVRHLRLDARGLRTLELAINCGRVRVAVRDDARHIEARVTVISARGDLEHPSLREALTLQLSRDDAGAARLHGELRGEDDEVWMEAAVTVPRALVLTIDHGPADS
jgi:hypothetical protein